MEHTDCPKGQGTTAAKASTEFETAKGQPTPIYNTGAWVEYMWERSNQLNKQRG